MKKTPATPETATLTLPGTAEKVIKSANPNEPDKAQISVGGAEEPYREIRIDNALQDGNGEAVVLKSGAVVEVTVGASADATASKKTLRARSKNQFEP